MTPQVLIGEGAFSRIFYDVEKFGLPIYHDMAHAIVVTT